MRAELSRRDADKDVILVIEDDRALRDGLAMNLRIQGYEVLTAEDGESGMRLAFEARPDLIVLDIMMPCCSGLDILEALRERGEKVPVLILSARGAVPDKVAGLNLGADDYMTKPFDRSELIARIEARLRGRRAAKQQAPEIIAGVISIDQASRKVTADGREVHLSAREFDLLRLLAATPGRVFTRENILQRLWGWDYDGTARTVDNFVAALRKKLGPGRAAAYIRTVPRVGYKLDVG